MRRKFSGLWVLFLPSSSKQRSTPGFAFCSLRFGDAMCSTFLCVCACPCAALPRGVCLQDFFLPGSGGCSSAARSRGFPGSRKYRHTHPVQHTHTHTHSQSHAQSRCPVHPHAGCFPHHLQPRRGGRHSSAADRGTPLPATRPRVQSSAYRQIFTPLFPIFAFGEGPGGGDDEAAALLPPPCAPV